jgi:mRNA interferase MazF
MRPIHLAHLDKTRPVVVLTREIARAAMTRITVAPVTGTIRGLSTEVRVGPANGLDGESVISLDNIATIRQDDVGRLLGVLSAEQERELAQAVILAFDLDV